MSYATEHIGKQNFILILCVFNTVKISRRTGSTLFVLALLSSFIARYPLFKVHTGGMDSELILYFSKSMASRGVAAWIANPSSYFGLHRFSYPQGAPFLFSSFIQLARNSSENMIFFYNGAEIFICVTTAFLFGLLLRKKDSLFAFFAAFIFGVAPTVVYVSSWTLTARGLFVSIFAVIFLILFSRISTRKKEILLFFFLILIFSIHRMAFFLSVTLFPTYLVYLFYMSERKIGVFSGKRRILQVMSPFIISIIFLIAIFVFYFGVANSQEMFEEYSSGRLVSGSSFLVLLINIGVTFIVSAGIPIVFSFIAMHHILKERRIQKNMMILLIFIIFSISILFYKNYFRAYSSFILGVFAAVSITDIFYTKINYKKIRRVAVPTIIVFTLIFSIFMQGYWNGAFTDRPEDYMDYGEESLVVSIKDIHGENFFSSLSISRLEIAHTDGEKLMMPFVKEEDPYYEATAYGYLSPDDLNLTFKPNIYSKRLYLFSPGKRATELYEQFSNSSFYDIYILKNTDNGTLVNEIRRGCYVVYATSLSNREAEIYLFDRSNEKIRDKKVFIH